MGGLREHGSGREIRLFDRFTVGRSQSCDLVLAARDVSGQHAELRWTGARWEVHDLGSRNGTYVDDARLDPGTRVGVTPGACLRFGRESPAWTLVDAAGPQPMARNLATDAWCVADGGYLAVPDAHSPELCVFQDSRGAWVMERDGTASAVEDRAAVATQAGGTWRLYLPSSLPGTWSDDGAPVHVADLRLRFAFTRDEEHVELRAQHGDRCIDLQARAHHYPLLLLARRRLADREAGAAEAEQGWLRHQELAAMLRIDAKHLNITIHRARSQLGKLGVADAAALVERRAGMGQLRLGCGRIELVALEARPA